MWHHMGPGIGIPTIEINGIASRVNFAPKHLEKVGCYKPNVCFKGLSFMRLPADLLDQRRLLTTVPLR